MWYILSCVFSFGAVFFLKVARKKALIEVINQQAALARQSQQPPHASTGA